MKNILFLCNDTSCIGPITEGLAKKHLGHMAHFYSAGIQAKAVDPFAIKAMRNHEVVIGTEPPKSLEDVASFPMDFVILLCEGLSPQNLSFTGARIVQHVFDNPQEMAKNLKNAVEIERCYADACEEIESFVTELPKIYPDYF